MSKKSLFYIAFFAVLVVAFYFAMTRFIPGFGKVDLPVPDDFSKMIAVRACSDMHGVRTRSENKKAIAICGVLALAGFALLGTTAREAVLALTGTFINSVIGIAGFLSSVAYDAVAGLVVITRVLGHKVVSGNASLGVLLVVLAVTI